MSNDPSGTVTFLFTDIEGSTRLWQEQPEAMAISHARHDEILRTAIESNHGYVFQIVGDSFSAAFHNAVDAVKAVLTAQRGLVSTPALAPGASVRAEKNAQPYPSTNSGHRSTSNIEIKVRMGLHTGTAEILPDGKYEGYATIASTQRVMSAAHGGQTLLTQTTYDLLQNALPDGVTLRDMGEHRLKDLRAPLRLYQVNMPDLPQNFPTIKSLDTQPNNLPAQLTSFIGRERELREAKEKLSSARLLTLIGPGGTGKTRLSLQLAAEVLPNFGDGVWLVELAPLADPTLILQTIASVLGVRAQMGMPLKNIVFDFLRAKNLLLIFDNCEHLVEACAQLADEFLHNAPNMKIIASSREALGIGGETVYRVPSLSLPNQAQASREALAGFESIQLFVERARAANPKFDLTEKNASSIAQICRRLDGIPLALELAAARVGVFSAEQIASRLDDRFKLLTGGSRTALPRQQTLRALIDWSYDILPKEECMLLRRLSVFAGGWVFEAAESLCSDLDVLNLLTQLVNKSLVTMDDEGDEPRYRLLETIRQYARDKLLETGEAAEMRNRHLDYYVQLTETAETQLYGSLALDWVNRLEAEYDNLRAAIEWGMDNNVMAVLRMAGALPNFWFRRGYENEGIKWIHEALEHVKTLPEVDGEAAQERLTIIAKSWQSVSFMAFSQGDMLNASVAAATCAGYARQLGDKSLLATVLTFEAASKMMSGRFNDVDAIMEEVLGIVDESNDQYAIGMAYGMFGTRMMMAGKYNDESRAMVAKGLAALKNNENRFGHTMVLFGMAMGSRFNGRFDEARAQFAPLVPIFHDMGDHHRSNMVRSEMAHMERLEGHHEKAIAMYRETILEWKRLGHRAAVANQLECFAFIAKSHEQPERAAKLFGAAEALREIINIQMTDMERTEYEREIADVKANLDEKIFMSLWAEGHAMTMEQAIALALEE
jgi:predicted ATPase/class 3 adenylate cyclase